MSQAPPPGHGTEQHLSNRGGWLRAAVLGSNDAIVSTASLMVGVAASDASRSSVIVAGVAGLVAGSLSMAAGEYVSVSSQRDAELADVEVERRELSEASAHELRELAAIYVARGLDEELAIRVAEQLSAHDRLGTHLRDELGIDLAALANPLLAAWVSAASFAMFALVPVLAFVVAPVTLRVAFVTAASLVSLAVLGGYGAHLGGAPQGRASLRVVVGGALAIALSALIGHVVGLAVV